jgi:hypothetical protein
VCATTPAPLMAPATVWVIPGPGLNSNVVASLTLPVLSGVLPVTAAAATSVPAAMVVVPLYTLLPVRVTVPVVFC